MTEDAELEAIRRYVTATGEAADRALARKEVEVEIYQLTTQVLASILTALGGLTESVEKLTDLVEGLERQKTKPPLKGTK